jgi:hypothetical protein
MISYINIYFYQARLTSVRLCRVVDIHIEVMIDFQ